MNQEFKVILWESENPYYELKVDGKTTMNNVAKGDLKSIVKEIKEYLILRFKEKL